MQRASEIVGEPKRRRLVGMWRDERGQSFIMVALMLTALLGFVGIVIDVGWYEVNLVRVQRAADAAALAGVVYLPGNLTGGRTAARAEASKNGFTDGTGGVTVTADQDAVNTKIMLTSVTTPVRTYFAQLFGVTSFTASRRARAEFILPVPMGSPQAWFGVNVLCGNANNPPACPGVTSATGAGTLASQGFWGAVEMKGSTRGNGDAYSTYYNALGTGGLNAAYDPLGYSYIVEFPAGTANGKVWIYDPLFCATGQRTSSPNNRLGAGDVWFSNGGTAVTTSFKLWDMQGTPYSTADDTLQASDTGLFSAMTGADYSNTYKGDQQWGGGASGGGLSDCSSSVYHNNWWMLASGLSEGDYRLQVTTTTGTSSNSQDALNAFGIQATSTAGTSARVYGQSRMCVTMNVDSGTSIFYLAQIDPVHAGKTLEIKLFDAGDITNTTLRIKMPGAASYSYANFSWTSTGWHGPNPFHTSGGPVSSLQTSGGSGSGYFQNEWLTMTIPLPATYGVGGLTPPGEPGAGWWKIEYTTGANGLEVTTWEVNIRGNPVHLVIP
jgi:Flp pilus assembly protein TadG